MIHSKFTEYSLGFYFNKDRTKVILIGKMKPLWQSGKMNGVGGKIELNVLGESEGPWVAMLREFEEETGIHTDPDVWRLKTTMTGKDWRCYVFAGFHNTNDLPAFRDFSSDEEIAVVVDVKDVFSKEIIPNLQWLIPLCLDDNVASVQATYY